MYTDKVREELYEFIINHKTILALRQGHVGFPEQGTDLTRILRRALGVSNAGKFHVNKERPVASPNVWERYYSNGTPELLEYLARYAIVTGKDISVDPDKWIAKLPRGGNANTSFTKFPTYQNPVGASAPEIDEFISDLPDWGELYTNKGLNYLAVLMLRFLTTGKQTLQDELEFACDNTPTIYPAKMCQGTPRTKSEPIEKYNLTVKLLGDAQAREEARAAQAEGAQAEEQAKLEQAVAKEAGSKTLQAINQRLEAARAATQAKELETLMGKTKELLSKTSMANEPLDLPNNLKQLQEIYEALEELFSNEQ